MKIGNSHTWKYEQLISSQSQYVPAPLITKRNNSRTPLYMLIHMHAHIAFLPQFNNIAVLTPGYTLEPPRVFLKIPMHKTHTKAIKLKPLVVRSRQKNFLIP